MAEDMAALLEDPVLFAITIAFGLAFEAVLLLLVSGIGGAIAAKLRGTLAR